MSLLTSKPPSGVADIMRALDPTMLVGDSLASPLETATLSAMGTEGDTRWGSIGSG